MANSARTTIDILSERTVFLWLLAIVFFGVGDIATTMLGLSYHPVAEAGPIVEIFIHKYGLSAIIFLKIAAFVIAYLMWRAAPDPHNTGVPLGLSTLGVLVTGWNIIIIVASM